MTAHTITLPDDLSEHYEKKSIIVGLPVPELIVADIKNWQEHCRACYNERERF